MPERLEDWELGRNIALLNDEKYWEQTCIGECIASHSTDFGTSPEEITLYDIKEPYKTVIREALKKFHDTQPNP